MATIHHAVVKSAASKGVILTFDPDEGCVKAHRPEPNREVTLSTEDLEEDDAKGLTELARDAWNALDEILAWEADHPGFRIVTEDGDFVGYAHDGRALGEEVARDPDLNDLFETLLENGGAHSDEADDEEEDRGSVVKDKYKQLYKERGDITHCGDWLAETLKGLLRVKDPESGKEVTDIDRLETIANANGVTAEKYGRLGVATRGWQGRYRMTVRLMMAPLVAAKGFLFIPEGCGRDTDTELKAPKSWCDEHAPKVKQAAENPAPKAAAKTKAKSKAEAGLKAANEAIKSSRKKVTA